LLLVVVLVGSTPTNIPCNAPLQKSTNNLFLWLNDYVPLRIKHKGKGKLHKLPWNYQLSVSSLRTCIEHWENGVSWIDVSSQVITHHIVPFCSLEPVDFSHKHMRDKFNKLKYVMKVLEKVIPVNTTLRSSYEDFIVPFLIKVALSQSRKYKNVKIREIKPTSWYSYFHKYEKLNSISRPNVSLINSSSTLTTTAITVNPISTTTTVNQGSNTSNRLQYNQFNTQQSI